MAGGVTAPEDKARAALALVRKAANQWLDGADDRTTRAAFVVGCQRSGTTMLIDVLRRSPSVWVYPEKDPVAYADYRLRSPATVDRLLWLAPADVAVFKPLCDAHLTDRLLDVHEGSRAVWLVRGWRDVATSSVAKWGDHQLRVVEALADGRGADVGWRGERVPAAMVDQLQQLTQDGLSPTAGAALFWYLRNSFFFALDLEADDRVHLVRYEDLAAHPHATLEGVMGHLRCAWSPRWADEIDDRRRVPNTADVPDEVVRVCDALAARFDAVAEAAIDS